ncbi:MAG: arylsulfotransferase family protein [Kofleriaceae bacterium]
MIQRPPAPGKTSTHRRGACLVCVLAAAAACGDNLAGSPDVVDLQVSPLPLTPAFTPEVTDYYLRCAAGANPVELAITDGAGTTTTALTLAEDQLVAVRDQYFIRCLPADFPALTVAHHPAAGTPTPGWYLVNGGAFAAILDGHGTPVWYRRGTRVVNVSSPAPGTVAFVPDSIEFPYGVGDATAFTVLDLAAGSVRVVQTVGVPTDVHEFVARPDGNVVVLSYPLVPHVDLTGLASFGADETIADCEIQELDPGGQPVWTWRASDHIDAVTESVGPLVNDVAGVAVVDPFHCNAVDVDASGDLLVSMRHADALYYVDRATGQVVWKLGGTPTNRDGAAHLAVVDDPQTTFARQHDARFLPDGNVLMYDNHGGADPGVARCAEYALDVAAGTAALVWQAQGSAPSGHQGSCRRAADGATLIGWGYVPDDPRVLTELSPTGAPMFDVSLGGAVSYRAVKVPPSQFDVALLRATAGQ